MSNTLSAQNVKEQNHPLGEKPLDKDVETAIIAKSILRWDSFHAFWKAKLAEGKICWDAVVGDIFTAAEKEDFRKKEKMLISIPELVPIINALEGMQIAGRREGIIVPISGQNAPPAEIIKTIIKKLKTDNQLATEMTAMFTDGNVTGFPSAIWLEKTLQSDMSKSLAVYHEQWDATLPDPRFMKRDVVSDSEEIIRVRVMSKDQTISNFPDREDEINKKFPDGSPFDKQNLGAIGGFSASERDIIFNQISSYSDLYARSGLIYVFERNHFVTMNVTVYASPKTSKVELLPPEYTQADINKWLEFNPDYHPIKQRMRILWVTTCAAAGVLLENRMHWFQEDEFPCAFYIPRFWNNKPRGMVEFIKSGLKGRNVTKIEHLHSLRLANDNLVVIKEGSVVNVDDALNEKAKPAGVIIRTRNSAPDDIEFPLSQREQMGWKDMSDDFMADIERLSVDRSFQGAVGSSQESGKVVQVRNQQTAMKYSPYIESYNLTDLRVTRLMLLAIPYVYTEEEIHRFVDDSGDQQEVTLNQQTGYDWASTAVAEVKNNLVGARYDYVPAPGDNSVTAQEHEMNVFNEILDNLSRVPEQALWPFLLSSVPNRIAQEFGRKLQAYFDAQANQPPEDPIKISLSIDGSDLLHNQKVITLLASKGINLSEQTPQSTAPGQLQPPEGGGGQPMPQAAQPAMASS